MGSELNANALKSAKWGCPCFKLPINSFVFSFLNIYLAFHKEMLFVIV